MTQAVELRFGVTFRTADGQPAAETGPVADYAPGALTWALTHLGKPVRDLPHDHVDTMTEDPDATVSEARVERGLCHLTVHRDLPRIVWDTTDPTYTGPTARLRIGSSR